MNRGSFPFFEFFFFAIGSGVAGIVKYGLYFSLTIYLHAWYILSSIIAFVLSNIIGFIIQKYWVFNRNHDKTKLQSFLYFILAIGFLVMNTCLLYVCVESLHINFFWAQVFIGLLLGIFDYKLTKKIFHL